MPSKDAFSSPPTALPGLVAGLRVFSRGAALAVVGIATAVLIGGWWGGVERLKTVSPGLASMKVNTALGFLIAAAAICLWSDRPTAVRRRGIVRLAGVAVAVLGGLSLIECVFAWDLGIDNLIVSDSSALDPWSPPGRMSPPTALGLLLMGSALWCLPVETSRGQRPAEYLALATAVTAMIVVVGYLFSAARLYQLASYTGMALHTALAFLLLCASVLAACPDRGLMAIATSRRYAGMLVRRLMPTCLVALLAWNVLDVAGARIGLYPADLVAPLSLAGGVIVLTLLIGGTALAVDRAEAKAALQAEWFRVTLMSIDDAVITLDDRGRVSFMNGEAETLTGWSWEDARGRSRGEVFRGVRPDGSLSEHCPADEGGDVVLWARDGRSRLVEARVSPIRDAAARTLGTVLVFRDVTESRRTAENLERLNLDLEHKVSELETLLRVLPVPIAVTHDPTCELIFANPAFSRLLGVETGQNVSMTAPPEERPPWRALRNGREIPPDQLPIQRAVALGVPVNDEEFQLDCGAGKVITLVGRAAPLKDERGQVTGCIGAFLDVTEQRRLEGELKAQAAQLQALDRRKDEFLATLSHELRNPLAPIRNVLEILGSRTVSKPAFQHLHEILARQVRHLSLLIDDLLDISRIRSGKIALERRPVDLHALVCHATEAVSATLAGRQQVLVPTSTPADLTVEGDEIRLAQVLTNLLDNASKYSPEKARIWIDLESDGPDAIVRVRDEGSGIDGDLLPRVFDLFAQGEQPLDRAAGGLGIGLALVRSLVAMHGGTVTAESPGPGRGSVFTVRLARIRPPDASPRGPAEPETAACAIRRRVLVVDDNADAAESLALLLEIWGHDARTATSGLTALEIADAYQPDVAVLDLGLPGLDGYAVARRLRARWGTRTLLLVAVTGYGLSEDRERSRTAGFDHHMLKPLDTEALRSLLTSYDNGEQAPHADRSSTAT